MNELSRRRAETATRSPGTGQRRSVWFGAATVLVCLVGSACGSDERPPPAPTEENFEPPDLTHYDSTTADARDVFADGECAAGTTQTCRIYLPSHDGIQPCFVGMQACVETHWGACDDAVLVDANADDAELETTP
jgi:hypothetical protein